MSFRGWVIVVAVALCRGRPRPSADDAEDKALATVERLGGQVRRDEAKPGKPVSDVTLRGKGVTDADLKDLAAFKGLDWPDPHRYRGDGCGAQRISHRSRGWSALSLRGSKATDAGLKELAPLKGLVYLRLCAAREITDAGLKELAPLKGLKHAPPLRHRGDERRGQGTGPTQGTDDPRPRRDRSDGRGVEGTRSTRRDCSNVNLSETKVTDAGLKELARIKGLATSTSRQHRGDGRGFEGARPVEGH